MTSGIITAVLLVAFVGIAIWAYSARNRSRFADAANLPLVDEDCSKGEQCCGGCQGSKP